jgi:Baseplate J-like protein
MKQALKTRAISRAASGTPTQAATTTLICPCDATAAPAITNLPGLPQIVFRAGDFNSFRTALLTPLASEVSLSAWNSGRGIDSDPSVIDLGVMIVEWFAYLADILTFYNERIANEDYLRTCVLPPTPAALVNLLGYIPRPTIGATGFLAALLSPTVVGAQTIALPEGLEFQSKPGPGQTPQSFELHPATTVGLPASVRAIPPPTLLGGGSTLLLNGAVTSISNGMQLLLGPRDEIATPNLIAVSAVPAVQTTGTGKQTAVAFTVTQSGAAVTTAASSRLLKPNQNAGLWTVNNGTSTDPVIDPSGQNIQMAGLLRQIQPGDWAVFTVQSAAGVTSQAIQISSVLDVLGDASTGGGPSTISPGPPTGPTPIPILHTKLVLQTSLSFSIIEPGSSISVLFGWVEAGVLVDQPPTAWNGISANLQPIQPATFPQNSPLGTPGAAPILLADSAGNGAGASATVASDGGLSINWPSTTPTPLNPTFTPPITLYYDLLPVSAGKTVTNEIVGSGDSTQTGQSFQLAKSPVTYLASGSAYASTIVLTVNGLPWTEVPSFYNQGASAQVFVARQDAKQNTHVDFGDGVNGTLVPTGTNNIVATYRFGGGASSPAAGKLTVLAKSFPGLQSVVNPVAVAGGSDPDPASLVRQYAPRSVLTFGRAVGVFDYQAIAAGAPGVSMAAAQWSWDAANQRAGVMVYVAGQPGVAASVQTLLTAAGDPNRPVTVVTATQIPVTLTLQLVILAGVDTTTLEAAVTTALCDTTAGLFSPPQMAIGQALFDSNIEAVLQSVPGVLAVASSTFAIGGTKDAGPLHNPGQGCFFSLATSDLNLSTETP